MRFRNITVAAVVLAGFIAVVLHFKQSPEADATPVAGVDEQSRLGRLKQLEAELAELKALSASAPQSDRDRMEAQLNALEQQMSKLGKATAAAAADVPRGEPPSLADEMAAEEEQIRQQAQLLDERLVSEPADLSWSVSAAQEISRSLTDASLEQTQLGKVNCRATLCRIDARHDSREAEQRFIMQLGQLESFRQAEGFAQRVERGDGSVATTIFVSRSGHRLPNPAGGAG